MQYRELLHEWAWYFHEPKASENAAHECNNRDMHANECNWASVSEPHTSELNRDFSSNIIIIIIIICRTSFRISLTL